MTVERRLPSSLSTTETTPIMANDATPITTTNEPIGEEASRDLNNNNDTTINSNSNSNNNRRLFHALSLMASPVTDESGSPLSVAVGLCTLVVVGAFLGLLSPKNHALPSPWYQTMSAVLGYIYFLAWSVSFYPQVVSNYQRQSTAGLSADFAVLNVLGFACYTAYNVAFFTSPTIQDLYRKRHGPDAEITVQSNDVAFAIHALVLSSLTLCQIVYYSNHHSSGSNHNNNGIRGLWQQLSQPIVGVIGCILAICAVYPILIAISAQDAFNWLDYLYVLSFVKIGISLIKYMPQVLLNFQRKSTVGWSIWNILLDFTGGCLSDLQLVLDCVDMKDFSGITGNPAKFGLGFVSIIFDIIFMVQHYCLYAESSDSPLRDEQREPLLAAANTSEREGELLEGDPEQTPPETI